MCTKAFKSKLAFETTYSTTCYNHNGSTFTDLKIVSFQEENEEVSLPCVDFVLVWESKSTFSSSDEAKSKLKIFEHNLEQEGLTISRQQHLETGLHFVKIFAPLEVLKRYAEILKLRLPMKKFEHIQEVHARINSIIPAIGDVVENVKNRFIRSFSYDQEKFPSKNQDLTAVFSRDKEYLFDIERDDFFTQSTRSRVIEFILKRKRLTLDTPLDDFSFGIERALADGVYTAAYPLHDVRIIRINRGK